MLPARARLRSSADFTWAMRGAIRSGRATVVVHGRQVEANHGKPVPTRVGFVVSKRVGNSVTRNRVKRRLRHLVLAELEHVSTGFIFVVRALPDAALTPDRLGPDLSAAWHGCLTRMGVRP